MEQLIEIENQTKMPSKKKDKPTTCDAGTDPPPPVEYDPLNLDGRRLLAEFKNIPGLTRKAPIFKLKEQKHHRRTKTHQG
jgi:hypothetical protein